MIDADNRPTECGFDRLERFMRERQARIEERRRKLAAVILAKPPQDTQHGNTQGDVDQ